MDLYTRCNHCKKDISFSANVIDRVHLSEIKGTQISLDCSHCHNKGIYHPNKIKATHTKLALIITLLTLLVGTPLTLYFIWDYLFLRNSVYAIAGLVGMVGFPFIIYSIIESGQRDKIRHFNSYMIKD